jgi:predicted TIM-barrel fold metal-dependent hydrolase
MKRFITYGVAMLFMLLLHSVTATEIVLPQKSIVDFHVHVAGLGYGGPDNKKSGCFINDTMKNNFRFPFYLMAMGVTEKELQQYGDSILFGRISRAVHDSSSVSQAVILAMDGVINDKGELDKEHTQVYVPNEYVLEEIRKHDNLLFGASINPYRADAIARLEQAKKDGAVLVKWLPSIMYINPADEKLVPFYKKMAELDIPLLTHTGMEKSFAGARDELADPHRLTLPLSVGVTVIAAHIATTGESEGEDNFKRILPMFKQYPNLYADISSLTQINKLGYMKKALEEPALQGRLIYGTDWPLQFFPLVSAWYHVNIIGIKNAIAIGKIDNQWDRDVALKLVMGVNMDTLMLGRKLFIKLPDSTPKDNHHAP